MERILISKRSYLERGFELSPLSGCEDGSGPFRAASAVSRPAVFVQQVFVAAVGLLHEVELLFKVLSAEKLACAQHKLFTCKKQSFLKSWVGMLEIPPIFLFFYLYLVRSALIKHLCRLLQKKSIFCSFRLLSNETFVYFRFSPSGFVSTEVGAEIFAMR